MFLGFRAPEMSLAFNPPTLAVNFLSTDRVQNISMVPLLWCFSIAAGTMCFGSRCLATDVFTEPFPSNGSLFLLHNSCFEQICHNILMWIYEMWYRPIYYINETVYDCFCVLFVGDGVKRLRRLTVP
jgi:hypothetical protein